MKRLFILFTTTLFIAISAKAMDFEEAKRKAWFLTDKMAYELNLTPEQCDKAYQINLDYLMSIDTEADCYSNYWNYRNIDFRCILFDWQYSLYTTLDYFFRPIRWIHSSWYYPIYKRYRKGYYYFNTPLVYKSYKSFGWHRRGHNDVSPFLGMKFKHGHGMRDSYHNHSTNHPGKKPNHEQPRKRQQRHFELNKKPIHQERINDYKGRPSKRDYSNKNNATINKKPETGNKRQDRPSTTSSTSTKSKRQFSSHSSNNSYNSNRNFGR